MDAEFFITGGTGFIGSNLILRLLSQHSSSRFTLLIRAEDERQAELRLDQLAHQGEKSSQIDSIHDRLDFVLGDVTLPECGIKPSSRDKLLKRTTHIIHGAATLRFDLSLNQTRAINVEGTRRVLRIAQECCRRGQLKHLFYIGTSSVSGQREGHIYENELEMGQEFFNTYEQSKYETELLLHRHMEQIPITIFRPSIVIGDSRTGRTTLFNVIYYPLRLIRDGVLTFVPGTPDTLLDLVPVDWVAGAMSIIMSSDQSIGHTYHLTSGPYRATRLGDFLSHAVSYLDTNCPLRKPRQMDIVDTTEFQQRVARLTGRKAELYARMGLLFGYATVSRLFDTSNTARVLRHSGLQFPKYESYADKILHFCLLTDWGRMAI